MNEDYNSMINAWTTVSYAMLVRHNPTLGNASHVTICHLTHMNNDTFYSQSADAKMAIRKSYQNLISNDVLLFNATVGLTKIIFRFSINCNVCERMSSHINVIRALRMLMPFSNGNSYHSYVCFVAGHNQSNSLIHTYLQYSFINSRTKRPVSTLYIIILTSSCTSL